MTIKNYSYECTQAATVRRLADQKCLNTPFSEPVWRVLIRGIRRPTCVKTFIAKLWTFSDFQRILRSLCVCTAQCFCLKEFTLGSADKFCQLSVLRFQFLCVIRRSVAAWLKLRQFPLDCEALITAQSGAVAPTMRLELKFKNLLGPRNWIFFRGFLLSWPLVSDDVFV